MTSAKVEIWDEKQDPADTAASVSEHSGTGESCKEEEAAVPPTQSASQQVQDGGARAWLQVFGSFLVFGNLWGFVFAFGSFQPFYQLHYLQSKSASDIAWIGTLTVFALVIVGVVSGQLFDRGYFRSMLIVGGLGETLALFLLSFCTKYYEVLLAQGIMAGMMNGLLFLPGLALVGRSFKTNRAVALAVTTCGAPVGGIIYTLMFEQLIDRLGFAWTVRCMAFFMLGTYAISFPLQLWGAHNLGNLASGSKRQMFDKTALKDPPFWSYSFSNFFIFMGYMIPFIYMGSYGETQLGLSQRNALEMIMAAQAASVGGRLVAGYVAWKVGVMIPWITCAGSSGIFCLAWIGVRSEASFAAFACLYGAFSGPLISLGPSVFPIVCRDPKVLGTRLGMAQAIGSIAQLNGAPIAGALLSTGHMKYNYMALQLFSGSVMIFGACQLVGLSLLLRRRDRMEDKT